MAAQLVMKQVAEKPPSWGGARKGAGRRKPSGPRAKLPHKARPFHASGQPVLVTERFARGLPPMRVPDRGKLIADGMRLAASRTFRVIHFSILDDHLHLLVEAGSGRSVARGMQGLKIRLAKQINALLGRSGPVFIDRYHARALSTPTEVRVSLRYVLCNWIKHVPGARGVDPYSSARWFDGWAAPMATPETSSPVAAPRTWLAATGWRRRGLLSPSERPGDPPGGDAQVANARA